MPYDLLPVVLSIALAIVYVALTDASRRAKLGVVAIVAASVAMWWLVPPSFPWWRASATLIQVAMSVYILVAFRANR